MGYISMYMFKLCLGIYKLTVYKARGSAGAPEHYIMSSISLHYNKCKKKKKRKSRKGRENEWRIKEFKRLHKWTVYLVYSSLLCKRHLFHFMWLTRNVWARTEHPWKRLISRPTAGMTVGVENNLEILASCICGVHMYALVSSDLGLHVFPVFTLCSSFTPGFYCGLVIQASIHTNTFTSSSSFTPESLSSNTAKTLISAPHLLTTKNLLSFMHVLWKGELCCNSNMLLQPIWGENVLSWHFFYLLKLKSPLWQ